MATGAGARGFRLDWDPRVEQALVQAVGGRILNHAGEIIAKGAKRRAPTSPDGSGGRPSGFMRSKIAHELGTDGQGLYVDIASPAETAGGHPYGLDVELGTKPHTITSHGDYPLRSKHGEVFGRTVNHPGTQAQPYLRPAMDDVSSADFR
jgi:hypothetical protein